jgi:two-component system, OmpR family, phosphate regulon sensor histidine kinase PhoR
MKKTLFLRIFMGYAAVIALLAVAVTMFAPPLMRTHHIEERAAGLEHMALLLEGQLVPYVRGTAAGDLEHLVTAIGSKTGTRITLIGADGSVLADSEKEPRDMENHLFRPEIQASLRGEKLMSIRPSSTLKADMMYMSIPLRADGRVVGALRLSLFMKDIESLLDALRNDLLKVVGMVTLVALGLAFFLTRSVTGPLREVIDASKRVAAGDFDVTVSTRRSGEFRDFARSFNVMTGWLKDAFAETHMQNEEIRSILASIREGLCVLDRDGRIMLCNAGFRRIAGDDAPEGRHFWEVVRSSSLMNIIRGVRDTRVDTSEEVSIGERAYLCSVVYLSAGDRLVLTLRDFTQFQAQAKT